MTNMTTRLRASSAFTVLAALLAACGQGPAAPTPVPPDSAPRSLGLIEVTLSGVGTNRMTASAVPVPKSGVRAAALTDLPSGIQLRYNSNGFSDQGGNRYVWATFHVRNADRTGTPYPSAQSNLTFLAASVASGQNAATIGDTPVATLRRFDGSAYVDPLKTAIARSFVPIQKLDTSGSLSVVENGADLQLLPESAVADGQFVLPEGGGNASYAAMGVTSIFPYGFVVRNPSGDSPATRRTLPSLVGDARPTAEQYDGLVTFAVRVPLRTPATDNPYTFSLVFEVVSDPVTRVSQSAEEQTSAGNAAVATRAQNVGASVVSVLPGSTYPTGGATVELLCGVRTAGTAASPTATFPAVALPAVGEVTTLSAASCLPGGASGAEYTLVTANTNPVVSDTASQSVTVTASNTASVVGPPNPNVEPARRALAAPLAASGLELDEGFDAKLRRQEETELASLLRDPASRVRPSSRRDGTLRSLGITPGVPAVGSLMTLNVNTSCTGTADNRSGRVVAVGTRAIIVADEANPAGGFTAADYQAFADQFDVQVWPVVTHNFGAPADVDGNGRVVVFYTKAVNELTPPGSSAFVSGFFTSKDLFSAASCQNSNEGEMFYMLVPDPTGSVNGNVRPLNAVKQTSVSTIAHEFQHLINASRRLYVTNSTFFESGWLNEGLSHIAEELMFYANTDPAYAYSIDKPITGPALSPRQNITAAVLTSGPAAASRIEAFNTFGVNNYGRFQTFLQSPESNSPYSANPNPLQTRGAIWHFLRYGADRFVSGGGVETDPAATPDASKTGVWFKLVNSQLEGMSNLRNAFGLSSAALQGWFSDWAVSLYADDAVSGVPAAFTSPSWNDRSIYTALVGGYPLSPRVPAAPLSTTSLTVRAGGAGYVRFGVGAGQVAKLLSSSGNAAPPSTMTLRLLRTK